MRAVKIARAALVKNHLADAGGAAAEQELSALAAELRACRVCRDRPAAAPLPHEPNPIFRISTTARICIASQAAGTRAHASSIPFDDASGQRLRAWLGVTPAEFYDASRIAIVPMGFCFPGLDAQGGDLPPRRECAPLWRARLFAAMPQIELVLAIGQYAQAWHLGPRRRKSLTETVAAWREFATSATAPRILPLPHPSWRNSGWLKRNPLFEAELLPVVRSEVRRLLDRPVPESAACRGRSGRQPIDAESEIRQQDPSNPRRAGPPWTASTA